MNTTVGDRRGDAFPWITRDEVFRPESARLWLRWPRLADSAALQHIAGQATVAEMTSSWAHPLPEGEAARRIAQARECNHQGKSLVLAITMKSAPDRLIGTIGGAPAGGAMGIGYMLDPAYHSRGLATEAVGAFVYTLFVHAGVRSIAASSRTVNPASRRVLEKNGFVFVRSGPYHSRARGMIEVDFLELSRSRWKSDLAVARRARHDLPLNPQAAGRDISAPYDEAARM